MLRALLILTLILPISFAQSGCTIVGTQTLFWEGDPDHVIECHHGVVVSVSGPASDVGRAILQQGGNAVDAAIATAFALDVAYPLAGNLAGGGFMVIHPAPGKGDPIVIDYRECAPFAATPTMFTRTESQFSCRSTAVPGTLRGLEMAHQKFGSLPWAKLIEPAIALARDGFIVDANLANSTKELIGLTKDFPEFQHCYGKPGGGAWAAGDHMLQPDLAVTLKLIADGGADAFYKGPIADLILAEISRGHGIITAEDLLAYRAILRKPLTIKYHNKYDVYVPPPPSSGGIVLLEELNMLENFDLKSTGRYSPLTMHIMAECMRRASYDRARYIGDPAFVTFPDQLLSRTYANQLAKTIDLTKATPSLSLATDIPITDEPPNTTHFSIIDKDGMAVANTYTLERRWGSRVVVKGAGFILNNDMRAFNIFPGRTTTTGDLGTAPNLIAPGKRPLSSMTPTIIAQNGRVKLIVGSPGSQAIPQTVLSVMLGVIDFGEPLSTAVSTPRFAHQWLPDQITFEAPEKYPELTTQLRAMGHTVIKSGPLPQGDSHAIWVAAPNDYIGVADHRFAGKAAGY